MQEKISQARASGHLSAEAATAIAAWLTQPKYEEYRAELEELIGKEEWQALEDSFFTVVPFGTGGRRGTVGIGSNRINNVTIGESAQGMAQYLLTKPAEAHARSVVIAYDTRLTSKEFAERAAAIFAANGIMVYLGEDFRPTPELSFAVHHLQAAAGVVISASHNPPRDNGFKAYWSDGGQVVPPHDEGIMQEVAKVDRIIRMPYARAAAEGKITLVGSDIDDAYVQAVCNESLVASRSARIVYSPLHGTGSMSVVPVLQTAGFNDLTIIDEQATPDGNFPNVPNHAPNPELRETAEMVTARAQELEADLAITTDPDADRLGVVARTPGGEYQFLTGNQIAALLGHFVLTQLRAQDKLRPDHFMVKTIVTTDALDALAADFNVKIYNKILIGFKYVAELIRKNEGREEFLFGGEESHGILKGSYTRDKDAAVAALLMAELASHLKDQGRTIPDALFDLYRQYGLFVETLHTNHYPGASGSQTMQALMQGLRTAPPRDIGGRTVHAVIDRLQPLQDQTRGDVLIFNLSEDGQTRITVRPSGTEPKLKLYIQLHEPVDAKISDNELRQQLKTAETTATQLQADMAAACDRVLRSYKI